MGGTGRFIKRVALATATFGFSEVGAAAGADFAGVKKREHFGVDQKEIEPTLTYSKDQTPSKQAQRRMKIARQNLNGETGLITSSLLSSYKAPTI
jgi:hypothetical protein